MLSIQDNANESVPGKMRQYMILILRFRAYMFIKPTQFNYETLYTWLTHVFPVCITGRQPHAACMIVNNTVSPGTSVHGDIWPTTGLDLSRILCYYGTAAKPLKCSLLWSSHSQRSASVIHYITATLPIQTHTKNFIGNLFSSHTHTILQRMSCLHSHTHATNVTL